MNKFKFFRGYSHNLDMISGGQLFATASFIQSRTLEPENRENYELQRRRLEIEQRINDIQNLQENIIVQVNDMPNQPNNAKTSKLIANLYIVFACSAAAIMLIKYTIKHFIH